MNTIGTKGLAEALGISKDAADRMVARHDFPAPAAAESTGQRGGRPEKRWRIPDLPETITIKGKLLAVRAKAQQWSVDKVLAGAAAGPFIPPAPTFTESPPAPASAAGALPAVVGNAAAGLSTLPMCVEPAAAPVVLVKGGLHRKALAADQLDDKQRARREGSLVLCQAIDAVVSASGKSVKEACGELAQRILDGIAYQYLIDASIVTYVKPRAGGQTVESLTSRLQKMYPLYREGCLVGDPGLYLVPGAPEKTGYDPIHIHAFLRHFCWPNRPSVKKAWEDAEAWFSAQSLPRPAIDTFYRIEKSLPVTVKYRGRVTGSEWRALKPYVDRDVSMFKSNDIWVGDGHSFKAKVQHPIHGQPFVPEVTVIIDWVSRKIVGWSVDLAESTVAVSAAFRHAQLHTRARPLVYYSDNGSGQTGKPIDCPIHGTLARQCIAHETGIPGNPQGRGIIERLWQVVTIPLARTYPTCTWKGADKETVRKMLQALNKKDGSAERLLPTFSQFLDDLAGAIRRYNTEHQHRELGGLTPEQAYQAKLDADSVVFGPSDADIAVQWLPEVGRTPQRGVVSLFGNEYARKSLVDELAEGERVRVRYDIHNADKVFLLRMDGRPIGDAIWNGHKVAAFPVTRIEQLREQRADGKVARGEKIIAEAQAELGRVIEAPRAAILDFLPAERVPEVVQDVRLIDLLPAQSETETNLDYMETYALYMRSDEEEHDGEADGDPVNEVAAG